MRQTALFGHLYTRFLERQNRAIERSFLQERPPNRRKMTLKAAPKCLQSTSNIFPQYKLQNRETNNNKNVDVKTHSIPEVLRNSLYTWEARLLLGLMVRLPIFLKIPSHRKLKKPLRLHHSLDSELSLWNQPYHSKEWDKSNNRYVYSRRAIEWRPEDFFRPTLYSNGLEFGFDGTVRQARSFGKWQNFSTKFLTNNQAT